MPTNLTRTIVTLACMPLSMLVSLMSIPPEARAADVPAARSADVSELARRGAALRHGIESRYADLKARHALKPFGRGRNYITDLVAEFLPPGTSFDDAEAILRAAGCQVVRPPAGRDPARAQDFNDDVMGLLPLDQSFPSAAKASISLSPRSPGDYGVVERVVADITVSSI
jgi:hypothetical protein